MTEKELLYQIISREVYNILISISPNLGIFSKLATNYVLSYIEPYVDAFMSGADNTLNTNAASAFVKEEISAKVDNFIKKFEEENNRNGL